MSAERVRYLRVSLLQGCNFNCFYCRPPAADASSKNRLTAPEQFEKSIRFLHTLGIRKVRFTGGEPTLYKQLPELIASVKRFDRNITTAITSNGYLLGKLAPRLAEAGLDSINISLDTLDREKFSRITGVDALTQVLEGIRAARDCIPQVKLNCVIMKDVNQDEARQMIEFADDLGIDIRFIEYMPTRHNSSQCRGYLAGDHVRDELPYEFQPIQTASNSAARYYRAENLRVRVGFINPVSHSFCDDCDRLRLTADGNLYGCLFSGKAINLFELLEDNGEEALKRTNEFVASKVRAGCSLLSQNDDYLPSFLNMGG